MIFDQQNMFLDKATSIATSNVIANVGGGDAADPLFLVIYCDTAQNAKLTFTLKTSDVEAMTSAVTLATIEVDDAPKGIFGSVKLPYGCKKFLRLDCTIESGGSLAGTVTAGLTETVPNWKF